jgi:hypothetical protein
MNCSCSRWPKRSACSYCSIALRSCPFLPCDEPMFDMVSPLRHARVSISAFYSTPCSSSSKNVRLQPPPTPPCNYSTSNPSSSSSREVGRERAGFRVWGLGLGVLG